MDNEFKMYEIGIEAGEKRIKARILERVERKLRQNNVDPRLYQAILDCIRQVG